MTEALTFPLAFAGGVASFFSPCVLPLVPAYLAYLTGVDITDLQQGNLKRFRFQVLAKSIFFVLGFTAVFTVLGLALAGAIQILNVQQTLLNQVGGAIIIAFGIYTAGLLRDIPPLNRSIHITLGEPRRSSYIGSTMLGVSFGVGWTPCTSAILGSILVVAGTTRSAASGALLLWSYSGGLAVPFLLTGLFASNLSGVIRRLGPNFRIINWVAAALLIMLGIVVFTGSFVRILSLVYAYLPVGTLSL